MTTRLCAAIFVDQFDRALADIHRAAEHGADMVELRLDRMAEEPETCVELVKASPLPVVVTVRPIWEGGEYDGDEQTRISLIERIVLEGQPAYLDIELKAYQSSANLRQKVGLVVDHPDQVKAIDTGLILSSHDFEKRPEDLERRVLAMADAPACRVIKVAWQARSLRDNLQAFDLISQKLKPTIALCMDESGLASRVLAKKFGALLTFAAVDDQSGVTASGQPTLSEIKRLYRWDSLDEATKVFGVIGQPVGHSMSPAIHNAGFEQVGFNGVYLPLPIEASYESFKATVLTWLEHDKLDFAGASVTLPHKQNVLRFVQEQGGEVEPIALEIGAANTLIRRDDDSLYACNTDYAAVLDSVANAWETDWTGLSGKRVTVLGAGGAARAIVAGFAKLGCDVTIYNRTLEKAQSLAGDMSSFNAKIEARPWSDVDAERVVVGCDLLVNASPVGMHPNEEAMPLEGLAKVSADAIAYRPMVFDTIYNPLETRLLREAKAAGLPVIGGLEMFVRQAARQFELFTGQDSPTALFREVVLQQLGKG